MWLVWTDEMLHSRNLCVNPVVTPRRKMIWYHSGVFFTHDYSTCADTHTNVARAELKTEAASESVLRSGLFREQTVWLLEEPGRGNDRLTQRRRDGQQPYCRKTVSREQLGLNSHRPQDQTQGNLLFVLFCEHRWPRFAPKREGGDTDGQGLVSQRSSHDPAQTVCVWPWGHCEYIHI